MRYRSKSRLAMFRRVRDLLTTGPDVPGLAAPLAELDKVIDRLSALGASQDEHHRRMLAITVALRGQVRALRRDLMRPVARAARNLSHLSPDQAAALRAAMRLPHFRTDYEGLVLAARGMAAAAEEHQAHFVVAGLDADFITRLRDAADVVTASIGQRSQERQRRVACTGGVDAHVVHGAHVVRLIDALLQPSLVPDPARAAEWRSAIRWSRTSPGVTASTAVAPSEPQQLAA